VLLYELLTGQMPFDPGQLAASGFEEMRRIIRTEDPLRPSTRLSNLNAADQTTVAKCRQVDAPRLIQLVRGDLDWIVMKCLEKDRARRYDTANGLASDIQRYLSNEPIVARPPSNLYRFQKLVRRNKLAFAAAGAIAMMLVLGVLGSTWQAIRAMRAEREQSRLRESAQRAQANEAKLRLEAQTEAARSKQIAQLMKDMLQGVGPRVALGRNTDLLREILDQTARRLGKDLSAQPVVDAELRETLGVVYRDLGQYTNAEGMLLESLRLRKQLDGQESAAVASALHNLAEVFRLQVRDTEAEEGFREALRIRRKFLGNEHPDVAASLYGLAEVLRRGSGTALADAESAHREALAIRRKLPDRELETASSLTGLGVLLKNQPGKLDEAETCLRQAVEIQRPRLGEHPDLAYSLCNLGYVLRQVPGKQTEAEALLREALAMQKKILGNHRDTAMTLYFLAGTVTNRGEALILHREALDMRRNVLGEKHPDVTASLTALDNLLMQRDQGGDISSLRRRVEQLKESGADPKNVARALNSLALVLRQQGRFSESESSLRELLAMQTKLLEPLQYASAVADLANVLRSQGRNAEAEPLFREAIILFEQLVLKNPKRSDHRVQLGHSQWQLGQLLNDTGQLEQAERVFRQALEVFEQAARDFPAKLYLRQEQAFSHRSLAEVLIEAARGDEAEHEFRAAIALYAGLKAAVPSMVFYRQEEGYATWMLAIALERAGRLDAAEAEYRRAITQHEQAGAAFPKETALTDRLGTLKVRLVELLRRRGKLAEAKSMYREVAERGSAPELNQFGWSLATDPDSNLRDGTNAIVFAEKAVAATSRTNASYLDTLAAAYAEVGQFTNAVRVQQEGIALLQNETAKTDYASRLKLYENNSPYRDQSALAELARNRLREGKFAEAEGPARECLTIREREIPDDWHTFNARAMLGGALLGQKKYAEAEPLLLAGYSGMKQREARIPAVGKTNLKEALQCLMQLYEATDRPEQAAEWKQKLEEFDPAAARKPAPSSRQ
jgi:tetratricopeptide (TPR) repeat protein